MNDLTAHIKYLVRRHSRLTLPGLGTFVGVTLPAFCGDGCEVILPPTRTLYFEPGEPSHDELLAGSYARRNGVTLEEGAQMARADIEKMMAYLDNHGMIMIAGLGQFYKKNSTVEFKTAKSSWGYNPYYIFEQHAGGTDSVKGDDVARNMGLKGRAFAMLGALAWAVVSAFALL